MKELRWLISCVFLTLSFSALSSPLYYPDHFWQDYESGSLTNQELKDELFRILSQYHNPSETGGDQISRNCKNSDCFRHDPVGYKQARRVLFGRIHLKQIDGEYGVQDVYCDQLRMASEFRSRPPAPMEIPDSRIVNAEHTWPQSKFSRRHSKGMQKSDIHGLYPVYSRVNSSRGHVPFGDTRRSESQICDASQKGPSTESGRMVFEPPNNHKGNVARTIFYFSTRYQMEIDDEQEAYLRLWHVLDPVDAAEQQRNEIIFESQMNRNPFIDIEDLPSSIQDF